MKFNTIDTTKKVFIVAEIGNNHEGSFELAKKLVVSAAECGVDAVKFQTYIPERFISISRPERLKKLRSYQLSYAQFEHLAQLAADNEVEFFSTPLDIDSAKFLNQIQSIFKIASGDNNFFQLIRTIIEFDKPVIISTGLSQLEEIGRLYKFFESHSKLGLLSFLHCVSSYPAPFDEANLLAIKTLKDYFPEATIGYSDHLNGIKAAIYSVAVGARIVEKHFTLDKKQSAFRDHQLSADPDEMKLLVKEIRMLETLLGDGIKRPQPSETDSIIEVRRSIAAIRSLLIGEVISGEDIMWLRPGYGFAPGLEGSVVGRRVKRNISCGQVLVDEDLESAHNTTKLRK